MVVEKVQATYIHTSGKMIEASYEEETQSGPWSRIPNVWWVSGDGVRLPTSLVLRADIHN